MRFTQVTVSSLVLLIFSATAVLAVDADTAIVARKKTMNQIKDYFKPLNAPDVTEDTITDHTRVLQTLAQQAWAHFEDGTGQGVKEKTSASPAIWTDKEGFAKAKTNFEKEAGKLADIAQASTFDMDAAKMQIQIVGAACGGCHKKFKEASKEPPKAEPASTQPLPVAPAQPAAAPAKSEYADPEPAEHDDPPMTQK